MSLRKFAFIVQLEETSSSSDAVDGKEWHREESLSGTFKGAKVKRGKERQEDVLSLWNHRIPPKSDNFHFFFCRTKIKEAVGFIDFHWSTPAASLRQNSGRHATDGPPLIIY
jgi:hypothetical protein